jgi:hypothetical protein
MNRDTISIVSLVERDPAPGSLSTAGVVSQHFFKIRDGDVLEMLFWPAVEQLAERVPSLVVRERVRGAAKLPEACLEYRGVLVGR